MWHPARLFAAKAAPTRYFSSLSGELHAKGAADQIGGEHGKQPPNHDAHSTFDSAGSARIGGERAGGEQDEQGGQAEQLGHFIGQ